MPKKIYVGNMSYQTTEDQLKDLFAQYGTVVTSTIIKDRYTEQSKGFGFVEMAEEDTAAAAVSAINNTELNGRSLKVDYARERRPRDDYQH